MAPPRSNKTACDVPGCERPWHCRDWCKMHYERWRRNGDPKVRKQVPSPAKDFYQSALSYSSDECLIWPFARNKDGYAIFVVDGSTEIVSRQVCKEVHGEPIGDATQAAHSCGKGHLGCISPTHLSWKTRIENQADRLIHGTDSRGEKCGKAKLTNDQVIRIRELANSVPQDQIAQVFSVHPSTIGAIVSRKTWRYI